jgi:hypothetical protein
LKIDKDIHVDRTWIPVYVRVIKTVCRLNGVSVTSIRMCRSARKGQHYHIDIHPSLSADSANRLQWLLGDDCLRVDYNRARIQSGLDDWNKLFERIGQRYETLYGKVPAGTRKTRRGESDMTEIEFPYKIVDKKRKPGLKGKAPITKV